MSHNHTIDPAIPSRITSRFRNVLLWILQVSAGGMFLMSGLMKLTGAEEMVALFDAIGIGQWFRYATGAVQIVGAILLLVPSLSGVGAVVLAAVMVGAILTHLFVIGGSFLVPVVLLTVLAIVAYGRRERTQRLLAR